MAPTVPSVFFFKRNGSLHWLLAHPLASFFGNLSWLEGALAGYVGWFNIWRMRLDVIEGLSMWRYRIFLGRLYVAMFCQRRVEIWPVNLRMQSQKTCTLNHATHASKQYPYTTILRYKFMPSFVMLQKLSVGLVHWVPLIELAKREEARGLEWGLGFGPPIPRPIDRRRYGRLWLSRGVASNTVVTGPGWLQCMPPDPVWG